MEFVYRGLKADYEDLTVTEAEIDRQLEKLRQQTSVIHVVNDRPAQNGDELVLDYAGFCDGVQFPGGTAQDQTLTLGSGMFIPGFEEQLVGAMPGETVTVEVTFPTEYHADELAGKAAKFECKVHEIRVRKLYEMDDAFAKEVGHCADLAQMRQVMGETLRRYNAECAEMELQDSLIRQAAMTLDFTPSAEAVEAAVENQILSLRAQLSQQNLTLEAYCSFTGKTEAQLREELQPDAAQMLRIQAAVDRIVALEGLTASEGEIAKACADFCAENKMTLEDVRKNYGAQFDDAIRQGVLSQKALRLVREAADVRVVKK